MAPDARSYFTDLELQTQDGKPVKFFTDMLDGKVVVMNVIYTNCKDACPMITAQLLMVRKALGDDADKVQFISISSDPKRDNPSALKAFMKKHHADLPNWTFVTGQEGKHRPHPEEDRPVQREHRGPLHAAGGRQRAVQALGQDPGQRAGPGDCRTPEADHRRRLRCPPPAKPRRSKR